MGRIINKTVMVKFIFFISSFLISISCYSSFGYTGKDKDLILCNALDENIEFPVLENFDSNYIGYEVIQDTLFIKTSYIYTFSSDMMLKVDGVKLTDKQIVKKGKCLTTRVVIDHKVEEKYLVIVFGGKVFCFEKGDFNKYVLKTPPSSLPSE